MRELNEEELSQVTGGSIGVGINPATGPLVTTLTSDVLMNAVAQSQLNQLNVRDHINPAELSS